MRSTMAGDIFIELMDLGNCLFTMDFRFIRAYCMFVVGICFSGAEYTAGS